jgi:hypothetical protein
VSDLTTLAHVKAAFSPALVGSADDARLSALISAVSEWFIQETGDPILEDTYIEVAPGTGTATLMLRHRPVTHVASVQVDGLSITRSTAANVPGFVADERAVYLRGGGVFSRGIQNVRVVYVAGAESVPADVEECVVQGVVLTHKRFPHVDYQSKQLAGEVITFWRETLPAFGAGVLQSRRNVVPL